LPNDPNGQREEVAMVTFEIAGQIEPWMFGLRDADLLARHLIEVLAHFGNETALEIYLRNYRPND
jgi:hypothetical protein